jgi:hypothetical protein
MFPRIEVRVVSWRGEEENKNIYILYMYVCSISNLVGLLYCGERVVGDVVARASCSSPGGTVVSNSSLG